MYETVGFCSVDVAGLPPLNVHLQALGNPFDMSLNCTGVFTGMKVATHGDIYPAVGSPARAVGACALTVMKPSRSAVDEPLLLLTVSFTLCKPILL